MVDFKKHLRKKHLVKVIEDLLASKRWRQPSLAELDRAEQRAWECLYSDPAAEIMMEELEGNGWRVRSTNHGAGPAASQIFDAAVMGEQVDPS